ncbi:hypothetical protein DFH08DRAFT_809308 [Mycena albidolilacea]|uniref:Uncharacterized protein n=1 Tax=Mycena albidolilacea TaxID=1033008 RepID=A0AAD7ESY2_9AGAR|nr:hypothetical protein DFH08DRAFT_809308 [Mycena albidolilacea]
MSLNVAAVMAIVVVQRQDGWSAAGRDDFDLPLCEGRILDGTAAYVPDPASDPNTHGGSLGIKRALTGDGGVLMASDGQRSIHNLTRDKGLVGRFTSPFPRVIVGSTGVPSMSAVNARLVTSLPANGKKMWRALCRRQSTFVELKRREALDRPFSNWWLKACIWNLDSLRNIYCHLPRFWFVFDKDSTDGFLPSQTVHCDGELAARELAS